MVMSGQHLVGAKPASPSDQVTAILEQVRQQQMPATQVGQVIRVTTRSYERHAPDTTSGPAHLDPTILAPEASITDIWALADSTGHAARIVTYVRDERGELIEVNVIDENAKVTAYSPRYGETVTASVGTRAKMSDIGERTARLNNLPSAQFAQEPSEQVVGDQTTIVLNYLMAPEPKWLRMIAAGELMVPYAGDLQIQKQGLRLVFDRDSGTLLREEDYVITNQHKEVLLRSKEWTQVELLNSH